MSVVRAALVQTTWTGDKESMIERHEEYAREAAAAGAQVMCFQELFYGPYFCQVQDAAYYEYAESIPGPTTERFQALAAELGLVLVLPMYEQEQDGLPLQHRGGRRRRRLVPRQVPQAPHPAGEGVLGEVLLPPRQPRLPGVRHRGRPGRGLHLLRPALPRGLARARPQRRADRVQPVRDVARPVVVPLEARAAGLGGGQRVLRRRHQPGRGRGARRQRLLRHDVLRRPARARSSATSPATATPS